MPVNREPKLSSSAALWRYIASITVLSVICSVGVTLFLITILIGWGDDILLPAAHFHTVALFIATSVPSVVVPILTYRRAQVIRALAIARDDLHRLAHTDQLTGIYNRRGFDGAAQALIESARKGGAPIIVLMGDVDDFKSMNDNFGHALGDLALEHLAAIMRRHGERPGAVTGRQGGDEFAILFTGLTQEAAGDIAAEILKDCQMNPLVADGRSHPFTMSLGLSVTPPASARLADCMRLADRALLRAKREGRNRVVCVEDQSSEVA